MGLGNRALQTPFLFIHPFALNLDSPALAELHLWIFDLSKISSTVSWNLIHQFFNCWQLVQFTSLLQSQRGGGSSGIV